MDLLRYLNKPDLVVKFQVFFGVYPRDKLIENGVDSRVSNGDCPAEQSYRDKNGSVTKRLSHTNGVSLQKQQNGRTPHLEQVSNGQHLLNNNVDGELDFSNPIDVEKYAASQKNKFVTDEYIVTNRFFYYLFHFGANLGNEIFYITFYPFWIWNIDGFVGRRVCIFWALFMYCGQATKDILKIPRPAAPPVMRMEKLYALEYGMPSTHAMVGAGFPFSILLLTWQRYVVSYFKTVLFRLSCYYGLVCKRALMF